MASSPAVSSYVATPCTGSAEPRRRQLSLEEESENSDAAVSGPQQPSQPPAWARRAGQRAATGPGVGWRPWEEPGTCSRGGCGPRFLVHPELNPMSSPDAEQQSGH